MGEVKVYFKVSLITTVVFYLLTSLLLWDLSWFGWYLSLLPIDVYSRIATIGVIVFKFGILDGSITSDVEVQRFFTPKNYAMKKAETEYLSEGENGKRLKESISQLKKSEMEEQVRDNELHRLLIIYNYLEGQKSEISDKIESLMGTELLTKKQK